MSNVIQIQQFLVGKTFQVPPYQRDYSWTTDQVDDLLEDIQEALDSASGHFLGTVVLAGDGAAPFEIVDGQQRLTTLFLVIHALLKELHRGDHDRIADEAILLREGSAPRLHFGTNAAFADCLLSGRKATPASAGQRKLQNAYAYARDRAKAVTAMGGAALIKKWLGTIKSLEIIQFVADDTGRAIRMFQTVNDRGLPLTAMDKAKALLVYYSNRFLDGELDHKINGSFGEAFAAFDYVRESVREPGYRVDHIARGAFSEDDLLRYHYLAFQHPLAVGAGDFEGSIRAVYDRFLKDTLKSLTGDPAKLRGFISDYVSDFQAFASAFRDIIACTKIDRRLYRLFVILGLAARLYPLTIRMHQRGLLTETVPGTKVDLLHCVETCDVRVYKTRATDPAADIGALSHLSSSLDVSQVAGRLKSFTSKFMPDGLFQMHLAQDMYRNDAVVLILLSHDEAVAKKRYSLKELVNLARGQFTREHIVVQTPHFDVTSCGFADPVEYEQLMHTLGNLTLLSQSENSRCSNSPVHAKMTDPDLYKGSVFAGTRLLALQNCVPGASFGKAELVGRTQTLAKFALARWAIW